MTATMTASTAEKIYNGCIGALSVYINNHINEELYTKDASGAYITGISAFARAYNIDRSNLSKCLNFNRQMSLGLYQRIAVAAGKLAIENVTEEPMLMNVPLKTWLMINHDAVKNSVVEICFENL
jgi:hypothetical protein